MRSTTKVSLNISVFFSILLISSAAAYPDPPGVCWESVHDHGPLAYETDTHSAITAAALLNQHSTIDSFVKSELLLSDGLLRLVTSGATTSTLLDWARQGSIYEDDGQRPLNHFHDPLSDQGYSHPLFPGVFGESAVDWALTSTSNAWNLNRLIDHYEAMLASFAPFQRSEGAANTFRALGHLLHMVQDMAQPWHTRHDGHLVGVPGVEWFTADGWIEYYGSEHYGTPEALDALASVEFNGYGGDLPYFTLNEPLPDFSCVSTLPRYRRWFDTDRYTQANMNNFPGFQCSPGLSEYSNFYFFSDDTIFRSYPHPSIPDTDYHFPSQDFVWTNEVDVPNPPTATRDYIRSTLLTNVKLCAGYHSNSFGDHTVFMGLANDEIMESYSQNLLPKAIAYCTDISNHIFRGRLGISVAGNSASGQVEITITNLSSEPLTTGTWRLFQDDIQFPESAFRHEINANFNDYSGNLLPGQSFVANCNPTNVWMGRYTVLFRANALDWHPFTIEIVARSVDVPIGACCNLGSCWLMDEADCVAGGGEFMGEGVACVWEGAGGCPGACCLPGGGCEMVSWTQCAALDGLYQGDGTTCAQYCEGVCCYSNGGCLLLTEEYCNAIGGTFRGNCVCPECCQCPNNSLCAGFAGSANVGSFNANVLCANECESNPGCQVQIAASTVPLQWQYPTDCNTIIGGGTSQIQASGQGGSCGGITCPSDEWVAWHVVCVECHNGQWKALLQYHVARIGSGNWPSCHGSITYDGPFVDDLQSCDPSGVYTPNGWTGCYDQFSWLCPGPITVPSLTIGQ